ncbi:MAG: hypothetical protein RNU03_09340 [Candidatus Sedimenticola sp. (ex Thyasira tokunagai)]
MARAAKAAYWEQHHSDWRQSGLTQKAYCTQHDLKLGSFSYWRKRLASPAAGNKLIPLAVHRPPEAVVVISTGDMRMEIPLGSLEQVLPIIRRSLRESA